MFARAIGSVRGWALWRLPRPARSYILTVEAAALLALALGLWNAPWRARDVITFAVLIGCGALSIEASRRVGAPSNRDNRPYKDLLSAWTLPIALLLPPVYAVLAPVPLYLLTQLRVSRVAPVKRTFTVAAIGLSGYVTATVHGLLVGHGPPYDLMALVGTPRAIVAIAVAAMAGAIVNILIVAEVIHRVAPATSMRQLVADRDRLVTDAAELGMGVVTAVCWVASPALILAVLPPVLLLQRTLLHAELQEAARTDAKTRLANPEYWREVASREVARAVRGGGPLAVLLIDIDHFKRINDTYGHLAGDQALAAVAATLTENLRPRDLVGRFGGEEFAVLLPGAGLAVAARTAERIRRRIERLPLPVVPRDPPLWVTVSVGVAALGPRRADLNTLLESADTALYDAKAGGRNSVRLTARPYHGESGPRGNGVRTRQRAG